MEKTAVRKWNVTRRGSMAMAVLFAAMSVWCAVMPIRAYADEEDSSSGLQMASASAGTTAEEGVVFSTDYPGVSIQPGDTATFSLYLTNDTTAQTNVELSAEDLPDGWEGSFKGSSSEVSMIHVGALQDKDSSPTLSYSLTVPEDAAEDTYTVTLLAKGDDVEAELPLTIKVDSEEAAFGAGEFTAEYAQQEGASGTSFSFSTTLANNGSENETYTLSASGAPEGWSVTFTPSDSSATTSVPVDAGSSTSITVAVTPAQNVSAGDYEITCVAASATETLELPLTVTITGTYSATLTTPTGNLSVKAYAGETKDVTLTVQNSGNVDLENISLTSAASTDWEVTFDTDTIESIAAGESVEVTVHITPARDSVLGDYVTQITASNDIVSSDVSLRVAVQNHTTWGIVAIAIIAALVIGLGLVIRKFGRR